MNPGRLLSATLKIRSALPADCAQWLPLWAGCNTFDQRTVPADVTRMTWSRFFDACAPVHAVVAERPRFFR